MAAVHLALPDQHLKERVEILKAFRFNRFEDANRLYECGGFGY
jgi:hypothetical protein